LDRLQGCLADRRLTAGLGREFGLQHECAFLDVGNACPPERLERVCYCNLRYSALPP
jgi:hypothetical protein